MNDDYEAQAKLRFFIIGFVRLMGAMLMAFGLAVIARGFMDIPKPAGIAFLGFGLFEFLVMPVILSRKWKSPSDQ
jgi:uncharacterized membrane protein YesL